MSNPALRQGVHQRARDVVLSGNIGEKLRTVFAGKYEVSHQVGSGRRE
jgi:hypothetical protein